MTDERQRKVAKIVGQLSFMEAIESLRNHPSLGGTYFKGPVNVDDLNPHLGPPSVTISCFCFPKESIFDLKKLDGIRKGLISDERYDKHYWNSSMHGDEVIIGASNLNFGVVGRVTPRLSYGITFDKDFEGVAGLCAKRLESGSCSSEREVSLGLLVRVFPSQRWAKNVSRGKYNPVSFPRRKFDYHRALEGVGGKR
jgi:hypothetical protein